MKQFTLHLFVRSGWEGGAVTDEKGGSRKRGVRTPYPPPPGHAYAVYTIKASDPSFPHQKKKPNYNHPPCRVRIGLKVVQVIPWGSQ